MLNEKKTLKEEKRKFLRNDLLLCAALIIVAVIIFLVFILGAEKGNCVTVLVDGEEKATYSLNVDKTIKLDTEDGNYNTVVIKDGKAYVSDATCPDKICVSHRAISKVGESIICLPHKTVVSVTSTE